MKKNIFLTLALVAGMLLSLAPFTPAGAIQPRSGHVPPAPASLNEVVEYYGRLGDIQGQIGVVVEFSSKPAAVVYAEAKERLLAPAALAAITKSQVSLIQEEQNTFASALGSSGIDARELYRTQRAYNGIALYVDAGKVAELAKLPGIKAIHPLISKEIDHTTSVPLIGALQVWAGSAEYQGQGIKVAIIDTGIDYIHTNFGGGGNYTGQDFTTLGEPGNLFPTAKVVGGWDFAGDDYDADPNSATYNPIPQPDPDPMDCNGHGSHVSGTTAGLGVLPTGATYVESLGDTYADLAALSANDYMAKFRIGPGVAPKADLYALRVFGCAGSTDLTDVAIDWAMDPNGDNDLSDHLDVINMSLGSSFGSQYDSSAVASNNAALAGVLVVASAGNSGDVFYITGAPGVAQRVISVASSQDSSALLSAFDVTASSNASLVGTYMAGTASFGPQSFNVTGDAVVAAPYQACTAITNDVSGKIAVIQRGTCTFALKVENAQAAGAIGVLIVNNAAGFPPAMGGTSTATIPVMSARNVDGNAIVAELNASGTATITLDSSLSTLILDPTLEDKVSTFTSRGVARAGSYLKPDVTAPGDTIFSTANGTGDKGVSFNGTSMAAPHVTGVMALLRQQHPGWSVEDLKALVMNTATNDVYNAAGTLPNTPSRVGAGRVSVLNATQSEVVAYNTTNPELVSLPFGEVKVVDNASGVDQTFTKTVTVKNTGAAVETYNVAFVSRYTANPGITFSLLDSSDNPLSSLSVPAGGTETIKVKVDLDAALLQKTLDPTLVTGARSRMGESGGLVQLTSTGSAPTLRVPVHIAARAASSMDVTETSLTLPAAASGTVSLTPSGTPIDLTPDFSDFSIAAILELLGESPALPGLPVPTLASADLQYIGAMSNYPAEAWADSTVFFGVSTFAQWDTLYSTEFDIYIDINEDDVEDYVVYNYDTGAGTTTRTDALATVVVNLNTSSAALSNYINYFGGGTNTNVFNNNVAVLPVDVAQIGLNETTNTDFNFYIVTYHRESETYVDVSDVYHYDAGKKAFDSTNAAFLNTPFWDDNPAYAPTFDIAYNKAYMSAATKGLLFLHHHNAANTAEVVPFNHGNAIPDPWVGGVAVYADQQVVAVGRPHLGSQVASYAGANAGGTTQYVPMLFKDAFGGSYDSALYIQNLGNASATLSVDFISDAGTVVHTVNDTLPANASKGYWLPGISGLGASFVGGAKIISDQPVLAVGRPHIGAEVMTYNGFTAGATTAYLPMFFKNGFGTYNTALYIQNVTANLANLSIQYLNTDGTVACTKADTLGANASKGYWSLGVTCDTGSLPSGFVGGVKVTSDQAIVAVGRAHLGTQITSYGGFAGGSTSAYVPMLFKGAFGGTYNAALYLQNTTGNTASVTIQYRDNAGALAATQNVTLDPGAISSIWLPGVAGLPSGFVGGASITSTEPIVAVGRPHLGSEITAYNGASATSNIAYLPMLFRNAFGAPYNAAYYIQNTSASPAKASIFFYNDAGSLLCVKSISLAANATVGFWSPATACLP